MVIWRFWTHFLFHAFCQGASNLNLTDVALEELGRLREERNAASGATLDPSSLKFLDSFNDPVDYAYYGGYVSVLCDVKSTAERIECATEPLYLVAPSGKPILPLKCGQAPVEMKLPIDEHTEFGEYRCQYKGQRSDQTFRFSYRFCGDWEKICYDNNSKNNNTCGVNFCRCSPYYTCLVTVRGVTHCADLSNSYVDEESWCPTSESNKYCPGDYPSLCKIKSFTEPPTLRTLSSSMCPERKNTPYATQWGEEIGYGSTAVMKNPFGSILFVCHHGCGACNYNTLCRVKAQNGTTVETFKNGICDSKNFSFAFRPRERYRKGGVAKYKIICTYHKESVFVGETAFYFITFGLEEKPKVTQNETADKKYIRSLFCELEGADPRLDWSCKWENTFTGHIVSHTPLCVVDERYRAYTCQCIVTYRTCAPNNEFVIPYRSDSVIAYAPPPGYESGTQNYECGYSTMWIISFYGIIHFMM